MASIAMTEKGPLCPDHPTIPFIEGDGIGPEIMAVARSVVDEAVRRAYGGAKRIEWKEVLAGGKAFEKTGTYLPDATMEAIRENLVAIKGPLMTPVGGGIRSLNVALRQGLDLYVCQRPVKWFRGVSSPVKDPGKVNMCIFRENTEDIYAGIEWPAGSPEASKLLAFLRDEMGVTNIRFPETSGLGVKPVSREGTERLVRAALRYAVSNNLPALTLVHKGNIMKCTEGAFRKWGYDLAKREFPGRTFTQLEYDAIAKKDGRAAADAACEKARAAGKVYVNDCICDAFLQNTLLSPEKYSVIAAPNLNGDYISDQLAAMVGGIGIAPGANINYMTGHAVFEATHGTAPDIAGRNIVNPSSLILSAVMMLEYIGWKEAASMIVASLEKCFSSGLATHDLARFMPRGTPLGTKEFGDEVLSHLP